MKKHQQLTKQLTKQFFKLSLWPKKLTHQLMVLFLSALLLSQGTSLWLLFDRDLSSIETQNQMKITNDVLNLAKLLNASQPQLHQRILSTWKIPGVIFKLTTQTDIGPPSTKREKFLSKRILAWLQDEFGKSPRLKIKLSEISQSERQKNTWLNKLIKENTGKDYNRLNSSPVDQLNVAIPLQDGRWLEAMAQPPAISSLINSQNTLVYILTVTLLISAILFWSLRKITRPLAQLTLAATRLGRGQKVATIEQQGPDDIQNTIAAFNLMNERLQRFVSERTHMLAALSHDLRTPLTSMRLRVEVLPESIERDKLLESLNEMTQMSEATLAFISTGRDQESTVKIDIAALLCSVCDDLIEMGEPVQFEYERAIILSCRPIRLKRSFTNLIGNAIKYGKCAQIMIEQQDNTVIITIQDKGPGIPEKYQSKVFEPFFRIESSRSRDTGGIGLGLSIVQQNINSHGGKIALRNNDIGLQVIISLPCK
ncbi:sensor histidine kinase [Colwellia piezophila]|uniref:sensor histidine kinase n=1 Tax=Colwellia piezophila TaxID=211668 RepID=UPI0003728A83|nr:ATP-binding protein [Colwellia piezophila]